jgi:transcriptional regulator with XRE-family HTH domain
MSDLNQIEQVVRTRLRSLRQTLGLSLDELAARTNLSASTISRIETGKRTISLDILVPLATALQVDVDVILDVHSEDDVVIRPTANSWGERTTWMLSRPTASTIAIKMRLEPTRRTPEQRVHPGHDWFFVVEGRVRLSLGARQIIVETGEAAEFATMTPHAFAAIDGPAELVMIFDRDGQRAHVHHESGGDQCGSPTADATKQDPREPGSRVLVFAGGVGDVGLVPRRDAERVGDVVAGEAGEAGLVAGPHLVGHVAGRLLAKEVHEDEVGDEGEAVPRSLAR